MNRWDYVGLAFIAFMLGLHVLALHDNTTIENAISLQSGVLAVSRHE